MTQEVQQLLLKVDASVELARRELRKMDGDFDRFTKRSEETAGAVEGGFSRIDKAASFAKASIVGFLAGIGTDGIVTLGRTILQAGDELEAAAEKAGLSTAKYQTLKESLRALEVDGDKVDAVFGRLTDTLGAVQGGTAAAGTIAALDKMGITSRILNGEINSTDGLLEAIAGSAGKFSSQAEFTASVIDIVGKKLGVDLANALKDGGIALKTGEQAFKDAGGVVDKEYIAKLADANEAIDKFTTNSKSKLLIWAAESIGVLERLGRAFDNLTDKQDTSTRSGTITALMKAREQREKLEAGRFGFIPVAPQAIANARAEEDRLAGILRKQEVNNPALTDPLSRLFPLNERGTLGLSAPASAAKKGSGGGSTRASAPARAAAPAINDAQNRLLGYDTGDFSGALTDGGGKFKDVAEQLDGIKVNLGEINVASVDLANAQIFDLDNLAAGDGLLRDAAASITDAIFGATSLGDALVGTFARAGAALIESAIFDALGGLIGLGGGGGGLFGKAKKLLGFANGGQPPVGVPSIVGERGPELFVPRVPGTIIPNHKLGGGGGQTTIYNDFKGAVVTEELYARIDATGQRAAQAGALGGRQMAAADQSRARRRSMVG